MPSETQLTYREATGTGRPTVADVQEGLWALDRVDPTAEPPGRWPYLTNGMTENWQLDELESALVESDFDAEGAD